MTEEKKPKTRRKKSVPATDKETVARIRAGLDSARLAEAADGEKAEGRAATRRIRRKDESVASRRLPVLPLRNIVIFPHMIVPLFVGREKSVRALEEMSSEKREIILVAQKDIGQDEPDIDDIYRVGTVASVLQFLKLPDGTVKILVEGIRRVRLDDLCDEGGYFAATARYLEETIGTGGAAGSGAGSSESAALLRSALGRFEEYARLNRKLVPEMAASIGKIEDPARLADTIASHLNIRIADKQEVLEILNILERLERVFAFMEGEIDVLEVEKRVRGRVKKQMEKTQRDYYLNEQMRAIQKELDEGEDGRDELGELEERIAKTRLSDEARKKARSELKKLRAMSPMSAEGTVVRNYLDWLLDLPWQKNSKVVRSLEKAESVLNADHYGLEKVKERILEYLAVQSRSRKLKGPILCLVGPPGVGKTSLARSIADATGRKYTRMALGGMRDESEIRGHRRTYIGAMPGKIIQGLKKAGVSNPLFLLDEIDKLGSDWRGDPSSALLEVLDPEQNANFADHYLEVDYDLSSVMFITTANSMDMPQPLLDRMEIIRLSGYTEQEKVEIARRHLLQKQAVMHNLKEAEWHVPDETLLALIRSYTREAGVRELERMIARLARKVVKEILTSNGAVTYIAVTPDVLEKYAGVPRYRHGEKDHEDQIGVVTGLAWTRVGGEILTIESLTMPGKGQIRQTGKLGDVMKESVSAAFSYVRSHAAEWGVDPEKLEKLDIHVHLPEGAVPKDGPSAGIALTTAFVSVLSGIPVRHDVAMTGEVTLRGRVLEIGGLKEKLLAALRAGITTVLIPDANQKDLVEIPDNIRAGLTIIPVKNVREVLEIALVRQPKVFQGNPLLESVKKESENALSRPFQH